MDSAVLRRPLFPSHLPKLPLYSSLNAPDSVRRLLPSYLTASASSRALILSPPTPHPPPDVTPKPSALLADRFQEKLLFLESIGIDLLPLAATYPPLAAAPIDDLRASVALLRHIGLSTLDVRRVAGMCPDILAARATQLTSCVSFLLCEAGLDHGDLARAVSRRPRLLLSSVSTRLRPTLYFLQMLGVSPISRHSHLLSCSVEEKLIPRLEFLERSGFSGPEARTMVRRFPQLFCYSIKENLEPKFEFLLKEMGRELAEVREFPQYFSFSMENRIRPRHRQCEEMGVRFSLAAMLRPSNEEFWRRLEACIGSSPPLRKSPLWHESLGAGES